MLTSVRFNPGPGAYEPKNSINPTGDYFIASLKNSKAAHFSLPSLPRFRDTKRESSPGPGAYNLKVGISDTASSFISTFTSPKTRTFYHSDRKTIDIPKHIMSKISLL